MAYKDPEKKKANDKAYYEAHKEEKKAYNEANKERKKAYDKVYAEANKEKKKAHGKVYHEANKEKRNAHTRVWFKKNKEKANSYNAKRKALKIPAVLPTTDDELIKKLYKQSVVMSEKHGEQYHVDHIIPLSIGGAHHQGNLRVITAKENMEKRGKYIPELGGVWADNALARKTKKKLEIK